MSKELYHHGIKGQKWGVRRYQNPDGTLTPEGRAHKRAAQANSIYDTMSEKEKYFLMGGRKADKYVEDKEYDPEYSSNVFSLIKTVNKVPVSFVDVWMNDPGVGEISIGVRSDYRNKGLAQASLKEVFKWFESNPYVMELNYDALDENTKSRSLAKKMGFEEVPIEYDGRPSTTFVKRK